MFRFVLVIAVAVVCAVPADAQERGAGPQAQTWFSAGLGGGTDGVVLLGEFARQTGRHQLSVRGIVMFDLYDDAVTDLGLLYSRNRQTRNWNLAIGGGLGIVGSDHCAECTDLESGVGIPLMARAMWHPAQGFGLGAYGFGNLNTLHSFAGLALAVSLGKVR